MKRIKQLQPLSRQHHLGLHVARHARDCLDEPQQITEHWQVLSSYMADMREHFNSEANLIVTGLLTHKKNHPKVASILEKLQSQQRLLLQQLADISDTKDKESGQPTIEQVKNFADTLYEHIRFEERELLPAVEQYFTEDELDAIYQASPDSLKHLDEQR